MTPRKPCADCATSTGLRATLAAHLEQHAPAVGAEPPSPAGCVVLLALAVDCAALAIGGTFQAGAVRCVAPEANA